MEYLDLIKKYWSLNEENPLGASVTIIYFFLLERWDSTGKTDFEVSDTEISDILKMNRKTIRNGKDYLRNLGLISFQIKKGFTTFYKIIPDYTIRKAKDFPVIEKEKIVKKSPVTEIQTPEIIEVTPPVIIPEVIKESKKVPEPSISLPENTNTPTMEEFMNFAKSLEIYEESLDIHLKAKYETWKSSNWINGFGKPILDWKRTLIKTIPFLKNGNNNNLFSNSFPKINRPKNTYNE
ncbi:MAG: transcriptional regulator [Capnocytophaga sp.]|nr:transcriptional regulator [Capnocytophaga sp.]